MGFKSLRLVRVIVFLEQAKRMVGASCSVIRTCEHFSGIVKGMSSSRTEGQWRVIIKWGIFLSFYKFSQFYKQGS